MSGRHWREARVGADVDRMSKIVEKASLTGVHSNYRVIGWWHRSPRPRRVYGRTIWISAHRGGKLYRILSTGVKQIWICGCLLSSCANGPFRGLPHLKGVGSGRGRGPTSCSRRSASRPFVPSTPGRRSRRRPPAGSCCRSPRSGRKMSGC